MNKYILAAGVLVLVAAMCIPMPVISDGSDAFDITTGESGISWQSNELTEEQISKLYDADTKTELAEYALELVVYDEYDYDITGVEIAKATVSKAYGTKITDSEMINTVDDSGTYEIKFKATCKAGHGGDSLFENTEALRDLMQFVTFDNATQEGAVFEFDIKMNIIRSDSSTYEFVKNNGGDYVLIKESTDFRMMLSVEGDVKYTFTDASGEVTKEFSVDFVDDTQAEGMVFDIEFNGNPEDAVAGDRVYYSCSIETCKTLFRQNYTINEENGGDESEGSDIECPPPLMYVTVFGEDSLKLPTYVFYPTSVDETPLFNSVGSAELESNAALKAFLEENGTIGETFDAAKDVADSEMDQPPAKTKIGLLIGIFVVMVVLAAVAVIVLNKRSA